MPTRLINIVVGFFMLIALLALLVLALQVSGLSSYATQPYYSVSATFDNVGDLKVRSAVKVAGVKIGDVVAIELDHKTYRAIVTMRIAASENRLPKDSSADILTAGLLGSNYISLSPGFEQSYLHEGSHIEETHSALILENLIGQFLYQMKNEKDG